MVAEEEHGYCKAVGSSTFGNGAGLGGVIERPMLLPLLLPLFVVSVVIYNG